ncbi:ankyrin repeat domain-containing protein [Propionivibrio sp.]|uniref:ankyrin repeat domain-containing protein n=1 Tax=Propionivibrio sp. TaxID=2212460 RepID=UPI003BF411C8
MTKLNRAEQEMISEIVIPKKKIVSFKKILAGKDVNCILDYDDSCWSMLMLAIWFNFTKGIEYLIQQKCDLTYKSPGGMNSILIATHKNNPAMIETLVSGGVDINQANDKGLTSLMLASEKNNIDVFQKLIDLGAKTDLRDKQGHGWKDYSKEDSAFRQTLLLQDCLKEGLLLQDCLKEGKPRPPEKGRM